MAYMIRRIRSLAPLLLVAGCVSTTAEPEAAPVANRSPAISTVGLEEVMGADARLLTREFGTPDLDVREGAARKLQFSSPACVLDAYLYPRSGRGEAVVTYVDARLPDGRDMDRASCVAALKAKAQVR